MTKSRTQHIFKAMIVFAWIAFIGFLITSGSILISYCVSWINPDGARNLYKGLDLFGLRESNFWHYTQAVSLVLTVSIMKAVIAYQAISLLSKLNIQNPFTLEVSQRIEKISRLTVGLWIVNMLSSAYMKYLTNETESIRVTFFSTDLILIVGVLFIVSQIFKRGVEMQSENELTV